MGDEYFAEALEQIRDDFPDHRACLVLDDKTVRRYVVSWNPSLVRMVSRWPAGSSIQDLWDCVVVDVSALMDITGDSEPEVRSVLRRLQGLQLIYPDGSVPVAAVNAVTARMMEIKAL